MTADGWEIMRRDASGLRMLGFHNVDDDGDETITFSTAVTYLALPPTTGGTWTAATGVVGQPGLELTAQGAWLERLDEMPLGPIKQPAIAWTNVWVASLSYAITAAGDTISTGTDILYLAPTIGLVRSTSQEVNRDEGVWSTTELLFIPPDLD